MSEQLRIGGYKDPLERTIDQLERPLAIDTLEERRDDLMTVRGQLHPQAFAQLEVLAVFREFN